MSENVTLSGAGRHCKAVRNNGRRPVKQNGNTSQLVMQAESRRGEVVMQRKNNRGRLAVAVIQPVTAGAMSVIQSDNSHQPVIQAIYR